MVTMERAAHLTADFNHKELFVVRLLARAI
jgi:hypothetical protein